MKLSLKQILSDAKKQNHTENQAIESKSDIFDLMLETVDANTETLAQI